MMELPSDCDPDDYCRRIDECMEQHPSWTAAQITAYLAGNADPSEHIPERMDNPEEPLLAPLRPSLQFPLRPFPALPHRPPWQSRQRGEDPVRRYARQRVGACLARASSSCTPSTQDAEGQEHARAL